MKTSIFKNKVFIGVVIAIVCCALAGAAIWFGVQVGNSNIDDELPEGSFKTPTFSVSQQVADAVGVKKDDLKDINRRVRVKSTIVDENVFQEGDTIDKLMATSETAGQSLLTQVESTSTLYDYNADTYAVKLDNISASKLTSGVKDIAFARDNYNGEIVSDITFDENTGVAYVPKAAIDDYVPVDASQDEGNVLQAQLLYTMPSDRVEDVALQTCTLTNEATGETVQTYAGSEMISNYTYVQLVSEEDADKVDTSSIKVNANDGAVQTNGESAIETASDVVAYNKETGMLRIQNNAASLGNLSVSLKTTEDVAVLTSDAEPTKIKVSQMQFLKTLDGQVVTMDNLNGAKLKELAQQGPVQFYTDGNAYAWDGSNPVNEKLIGDTAYVSSDVEAMKEGDWSAWSLAGEGWLNITAGSHVYSQNDFWWESFYDEDGNLQKGLHNYQPGRYNDPNYYSVKYVVHLASTGNYPVSIRSGQWGIPSGDLNKTDLVISQGGNWNYKQPLSGELYLKSWCTHICDGLNEAVTNANGCMYSRIIAVDDYHLTISLFGGPTEIPGQTGSTIIKLKIASYGKVELQKSSTNTSITEGNDCYSLAGAEYQLYYDEQAKNPITETDTGAGGKLITDNKGYAAIERIWLNKDATVNASSGNYEGNITTLYLKETKAPSGYCLDSTVYKLEFERESDGSNWWRLKDGDNVKNHVLQLKDDPQNDPINAMLQKQSKDGGTTAQGAASFADCEVTVQYFTTTDPTTLPKNKAARDAKAFKKWVFKTDESGVVFGSNESYLVKEKSDKLFYDTYEDGSKVVIFPCGTYVLEETNAPTGFTQPSFNFRTFITTITPKENSTKQNPESFGKVIYIPQKRDDSKFEGLGWEAW